MKEEVLTSFAFCEEELLPEMDGKYRTSLYRVLVGHSLAGLFTVEAFLKQSSFKAYLAIDPSLHRNEMRIVEQAKNILQQNETLQAAMVIAQANNPFNPGKSAESRGEAFQSLLNYLDKSTTSWLRHAYRFFEDEDHFSVPLISMF